MSVFKIVKILSIVLLFAIVMSFHTIAQAATVDEKVKAQTKTQLETEGVININNVCLRSAPTIESEILDSLSKGNRLIILEKSAEKQNIGSMSDYWYKVQWKNYTDVWVYGAFIDFQNHSSKQTSPIIQNAENAENAENAGNAEEAEEAEDEKVKIQAETQLETEGVINTTNVRLRSAPTIESEILDNLSKGNRLIILEKSAEKQNIGSMSDYWYKVQWKNYTDIWVYGAFIDFQNHTSKQTSPIIQNAENVANLPLIGAISLALEHNEDIQESFGRISAAKADVTSSKGVYDLTIYSTSRYSEFNNLQPEDYEANNLRNAAKSYARMDTGLRQRVPTGGNISMYTTHSNEKMFGILNQNKDLTKNYLTIEFTQSLLRGIGDKEQRGAIRKALLAVEESEESKKIIISQVTLEVIRAYWILDIAYNNLRVAHEILKMATELYRREKVRVAQGISQGVDLDRAQLVMEQRQYTVLQYERDLAIAQERLKLLINVPEYTDETQILPITKPISEVGAIPDKNESSQLALHNRYELQQLALLLKQLNIDYDVNSNKLLPTLDVNLGLTTSHGNDYLRSATNFNDNDKKGSWFAGLTISYPLQNREARGAFKKTKELFAIAQERVNKTQRTVQTEVRETLHNFTLAKKGIPVAQKAYEFSRLTMEGEAKIFEMGEINNRDLLASYDAFGREEINLHVAIVNYNMAMAEYHLACGTLLERYQIYTDKDAARIR